MHHILEIIMPPTDDVEAAVTTILAPFNEDVEIPELGDDTDDTDDNHDNHDNHDALCDWASNRGHAFWDFWIIGGRFAGGKFKATLDQDKLKAFMDELKERKVTVSGVTAGKRSLQPASQIPMVDDLWNSYFPQTNGPCPIFEHSNDQYDSGARMQGDVMPLSDVPLDYRCNHVIFASPGFNYDSEAKEGKWDGPLECETMMQTSIWNGTNHEDSAWDGTLGAAIKKHAERSKNYSDDWRAVHAPKDDWLVVTVDYHS